MSGVTNSRHVDERWISSVWANSDIRSGAKCGSSHSIPPCCVLVLADMALTHMSRTRSSHRASALAVFRKPGSHRRTGRRRLASSLWPDDRIWGRSISIAIAFAPCKRKGPRSDTGAVQKDKHRHQPELPVRVKSVVMTVGS